MKRVSYEKAAIIFRAINGDKDAMAKVSIEDIQDFNHADKFYEFVDRNQHIQFYDEVIR